MQYCDCQGIPLTFLLAVVQGAPAMEYQSKRLFFCCLIRQMVSRPTDEPIFGPVFFINTLSVMCCPHGYDTALFSNFSIIDSFLIVPVFKLIIVGDK